MFWVTEASRTMADTEGEAGSLLGWLASDPFGTVRNITLKMQDQTRPNSEPKRS